MLKHSDDTAPADRADLGGLLERFTRDSRDWAEAEARLARLELAGLKAQAMKAALLGGLAGAAILCTMFALMQGLIVVLSSMIGSVAIASLVAALVFAALAGGCAVAARRIVTWRSESILLRWLGRRT